jgi:hypothetical protein
MILAVLEPPVMSSEREAPTAAGLNPNALTLPDVARLLAKAGGQPVTVEALRADLAAGAPVNADGTIHLVHYAAWLVKERGRGD